MELNDIIMIFLFLYWFQIFKDQCGVHPPFQSTSLLYGSIYVVLILGKNTPPPL